VAKSQKRTRSPRPAKKTEDGSSVRLNRYLSQCGISSRRKADELISDGQVAVNGRRVYELGVKINPKEDSIKVKGKVVRPEQEHVYVVFNKPKNVLTSLSDPEGRPTIGDFFQKFPYRIFPVGRLDWESEGLLILTNDGDFSHQVTHPKFEIPKIYLVKVNGKPNQDQLNKLLSGVSTAVGRVKALHIQRMRRGAKGSEQYDWLRIAIDEGRNRQIRRMFEKIGFDVMKLQRISIGGLQLGNLKRGEFKVVPHFLIEKVFQTKGLLDE